MSYQIGRFLLFYDRTHLATLCVNITKYKLKSHYVKLTQFWPLNVNCVLILTGRFIVKLSKICFLCTNVNQMITQQRFLFQLQLYNIFTNVFSLFPKVFYNILKIYELNKIYNKIPKYCQTLVLTIIINQVNSLSQLHLDFELYPLLTLLKICSRGLRRKIFKKSEEGYFLKCSTKRVLFCCIRCCAYSLQ